MKVLVKSLLVFLLLAVSSFALFAQEKTQMYYLQHENEILPDAQASFRQGKYDRAVELCVWHYIILGTQDAEALREKAAQCATLAKEFADHKDAGRQAEAEESARALVALNPDDPAANDFLAELRVQEEIPQPENVVVSEPQTLEIPETVPVQEEEQEEEVPVQEEEIPAEEEAFVQEPVPVTPVPEFPQISTVPEPVRTAPTAPAGKGNRLAIKANAAILDFSQLAKSIATGLSFGLYDIGGSPVGAEVGAYLCPALLDASLVGMDASMVFRIANGFYPKAGVGFFSCLIPDSSLEGTNGICGGLGFSFLTGGHFLWEVGAKFYPEVKVQGYESVSTGGSFYEFPTSVTVISGGVALMVGLGFCF